MKNFMKLLLFCSGLIFSLIFSGCGKKDNNNATPGVVATNVCQPGYVNTQYGCIPQGNCPAGQGMYQNTCVYGTSNIGGQSCQAGYVHNQTYGCLPQTGCPSGYGMWNNQCVPATMGGVGSQSCQGMCQPGYTQTTYGCLPQGQCMSCYGQSNNWCYPSTGFSQTNPSYSGW